MCLIRFMCRCLSMYTYKVPKRFLLTHTDCEPQPRAVVRAAPLRRLPSPRGIATPAGVGRERAQASAARARPVSGQPERRSSATLHDCHGRGCCCTSTTAACLPRQGSRAGRENVGARLADVGAAPRARQRRQASGGSRARKPAMGIGNARPATMRG